MLDKNYYHLSASTQNNFTLKVESLAEIKFIEDKLSQTRKAKIKFHGYKVLRMREILGSFSYFPYYAGF